MVGNRWYNVVKHGKPNAINLDKSAIWGWFIHVYTTHRPIVIVGKVEWHWVSHMTASVSFDFRLFFGKVRDTT